MRPPSTHILKNTYIAVNATALFKQNKTGVEWYTWQLIKYLAREWKESDPPIVLFLPGDSTLFPEKQIFGQTALNIKNANWYLKPLKGKYFWTQYRLLKFLNHRPPGVLFSPSYVAPRFLSKNIPAINIVHGLEGEYFPEFRTVKQIISDHLWIIPALKKHRNITVSEHTKKDLNRFYHIPLPKIKVILSGPGTLDDNLTGTGHDAFLRKNGKNISFLFLDGSNERKNLPLAIRIFLKLRIETRRDLSLYIAGAIKDKNIINFIKSRKKYLIPLGYISEKKKIKQLKLANFLLYPSFYEGFGFPVLEAQAHGAVPITLKNSGLDEIGGKGIIEFDTENEKKSIAGIIDYINNSGRYQQLQEVGLENVQKYRWQKCARETRKFFLQIISK